MTISKRLEVLNAPGYWLAVNPDPEFRKKHPHCVCADALEMTEDDFLSAAKNDKIYVTGVSGGRSFGHSKLAGMLIFKAEDSNAMNVETGKHIVWIAWGSRPPWSPMEQLMERQAVPHAVYCAVQRYAARRRRVSARDDAAAAAAARPLRAHPVPANDADDIAADDAAERPLRAHRAPTATAADTAADAAAADDSNDATTDAAADAAAADDAEDAAARPLRAHRAPTAPADDDAAFDDADASSARDAAARLLRALRAPADDAAAQCAPAADDDASDDDADNAAGDAAAPADDAPADDATDAAARQLRAHRPPIALADDAANDVAARPLCLHRVFDDAFALPLGAHRAPADDERMRLE